MIQHHSPAVLYLMLWAGVLKQIDMYEQLDNVVKDLLSELRIDEKCLEVMANGYSPDYPGAVVLREGERWINPRCKIQLSSVVAQKLLASMKKYQPENTDKVQSVE